jgi:hypothetical protein
VPSHSTADARNEVRDGRWSSLVHWAVLLVLVLIAFSLRWVAIDRYPGARFEQMYQDETKIVTNSLRLIEGEPIAAHYPHALYYWLLPQVRELRARTLEEAGVLEEEPERHDDMYRSILGVDPMPIYLLLRYNMVLFSMGIVLLLFFIGRRVGGWTPGLVAAACATVMPLFVLYSKMAYYDLPMTFWLLCTTVVLAATWSRDSVIGLHVAAALLAWTFTTKQNGIVLLPLWLAVALKVGDARWNRGDDRPSLSSWRRFARSWLSWPLWTAGTLGVMITLWAYPTLTDPDALDTFLSLVKSRYYQTTSGLVGGSSNWFAWLNVFWPNYAPRFLFLFLALGMPLAWRFGRDRALAGCVIAVTVIYFLVAGRSAHSLDRTMLPLLPGLCLGAAGWSMALASRRIGHPALAQVALAAFILYPLLQSSIRYDWLLSRPDTRQLAADWLEREAPDGASVATEDYGPRPPRTPKHKRIVLLAEREGIKTKRTRDLHALGNYDHEAIGAYDYVAKVDVIEKQARALLNLGVDPRNPDDLAKHWRLKTFRPPLEAVVARYERMPDYLRTVHRVDPPRPPETVWPTADPLTMYGTLPGSYFIPDVYGVLFQDEAYGIGPRIDIMKKR